MAAAIASRATWLTVASLGSGTASVYTVSLITMGSAAVLVVWYMV